MAIRFDPIGSKRIAIFFGRIVEGPCQADTDPVVCHIPLHSAGDLTGTEASGADVHVSGSALHDRLHALHVGLPGAVGTAVGMGNLDAEGDALVTEFAFGHVAYLLAMRIAFQKSFGR